MDCSTPGFPVVHHLLELAQTHVHRVSDAIQPSYPLSFPSLSAFNPASGSFPVNKFFASDGQSVEASASASVLPVNIQGWFPLGLTCFIYLQSKGLKIHICKYNTYYTHINVYIKKLSKNGIILVSNANYVQPEALRPCFALLPWCDCLGKFHLLPLSLPPERRDTVPVFRLDWNCRGCGTPTGSLERPGRKGLVPLTLTGDRKVGRDSRETVHPFFTQWIVLRSSVPCHLSGGVLFEPSALLLNKIPQCICCPSIPDHFPFPFPNASLRLQLQ